MNKKQGVWVFSLFCIILIIGLISTTPVRLIFGFLDIPAEVGIKGLHGSISSGSADAVQYQKMTLTDVNYELQPICLLKLSVCYRITSDDHHLVLNTDTSVITQNSSMNDSQIQLDNGIFKQIPQMLVQPKGEILITIATLNFENSKIKGLTGSVDWTAAGIQGEQQSLGNYHAVFEQQADSLTMQLEDKDSLLSASGNFNLKWNGQYQLDLKFESKPDLNKSVVSALQLMTKQSGLNKYSLKKAGMLSRQSLPYLQIFDSGP